MDRARAFGSLGSTKALSFDRWAGISHDEVGFMAQWLIRLTTVGEEMRREKEKGQGLIGWKDDMKMKKSGSKGMKWVF